MACNTNSLSAKIVISICDGKKLGHINNYEIDLESGCITAVFVPSETSLFSLGKVPDIRIPWSKIKKIGEDAILVDVVPGIPECCAQKKKWFR